MNELVKNISDSDLIVMCNEIHEWKNTGVLNQEGLLRKLFNEHEGKYVFVKNLEEEVLMGAHSRFKNVVKLLFVVNPSLYVK